MFVDTSGMTDSTENATPPKSTKSRNSNSSVQVQSNSKSRFEFVLQDTEESEFLDFVDFGSVAFSVETAINPVCSSAHLYSAARSAFTPVRRLRLCPCLFSMCDYVKCVHVRAFYLYSNES